MQKTLFDNWLGDKRKFASKVSNFKVNLGENKNDSFVEKYSLQLFDPLRKYSLTKIFSNSLSKQKKKKCKSYFFLWRQNWQNLKIHCNYHQFFVSVIINVQLYYLWERVRKEKCGIIFWKSFHFEVSNFSLDFHEYLNFFLQFLLWTPFGLNLKPI